MDFSRHNMVHAETDKLYNGILWIQPRNLWKHFEERTYIISVKSDNLQYNTMGRWVDITTQSLWLRAFQSVHYRITLKIKFHFLKQFLEKFLSNYHFLSFFIIFLFFYNLKKIRSNSLTVWYALRASQHPTVSPNYIFPIYQKTKTFDSGTIVPSLYYIEDCWIFEVSRLIKQCRSQGWRKAVQGD